MERKKKNRWKSPILVCMCLSFLTVLSVPAYGDSLVIAGETGVKSQEESEYTAVDGNLISEERLRDDVVEYDELGSLIHYGNSSVQEMIDSTERTRGDYQEIRDYLRSERASAKRGKNEAKENNDVESYAEYAVLEAVYSSSVKSYNEMLKKLDRYSSKKGRLSVEKQLTNAAQSLMMSWQSIELQKEYMEKMAELYQAIYENTSLQQSAGLATESDVLAAYNNWKDMEVSLAGLADSTASVCQNLYLILGTDDTVSIARIPQVNPEQILELDLESDIQKAISNNSDLIAERHTDSGGTASVNKKRRTVEELEEKVKIKMQQLYEEVVQSKQAYDAARTGLDGAEIRWNNARSQYTLGMLSYVEYLQKQIQYEQKKLNFDSADLALLQALENYNWAVRGIATLE